MKSLYGGCLCGDVRYHFPVGDAPVAQVVCHCRHCQRQSGSLFSVNLLVDAGSFHVDGVPQRFQDQGDSGKPVWRHFCGRCGSALFTVADSLPGSVVVKVGTLDEPPEAAPGIELYADHAAAWWPVREGVRRLPRGRAG